MEDYKFKEDQWIGSSYHTLECEGKYKGIQFAIRFNRVNFLRCAIICVDIDPKIRYLKSDNVYLVIKNYNAGDKMVFQPHPNFVMITDEYYNNPDPRLVKIQKSIHKNLSYLDSIYRPYDQKHSANLEYYENLVIEFIDWYLENF